MSDAMINKIQALLNSAESFRRDGNDDAANSYMAKADSLMSKHAIDAAILAAANKGKAQSFEMPERTRFEFCAKDDATATQLYNLCITVAKYYGCQFHGWASGNGHIIGLPSDAKFVQMVYTSLRMQLMSKVQPEPNMNKSFEENVYILHEAGINWERSCNMLNKARINWMKANGLNPQETMDEPWAHVPWDIKKKDGGRMIRACKKWCKEVGDDYRAVQSPVTFQRSYAQGFLNEVRHRFDEMKKYRDDQVASTTGAELALRDKGVLVDDAYSKYKQDMGIRDRRGGYHQRIVGEAYDRGQRDGRTADLGQTRVGGNKKELS